MSIIELKQKLHTQIDLIDNDELLEEVYRFLELGSFNKDEFQLTEEMKRSIDQGLEDFKAGKLISNEKVKIELNKWLNK